MTKHTPGPWYAVQYGPYYNIQTSSYYEEKVHLLDDEDFDNAEANAKLCASAPDLLEALQKICEMNYQQAEDQYGDRDKAKSWGCIKIAEEAIKKATI